MSCATQRRMTHSESTGSQKSTMRVTARKVAITSRQERIQSAMNLVQQSAPGVWAQLKQMASSGSSALGDAANIRRAVQTAASKASNKTILASYVKFLIFLEYSNTKYRLFTRGKNDPAPQRHSLDAAACFLLTLIFSTIADWVLLRLEILYFGGCL